ncbi:hypothetical protein RND81_03G024300 [Saponaria officinalis]|uniref:Ferritin-like superfamily n=1 Tax=Saponaria officinalis TaxID=3572 RepID=A0AAW1LXY3_SAPOF
MTLTIVPDLRSSSMRVLTWLSAKLFIKTKLHKKSALIQFSLTPSCTSTDSPLHSHSFLQIIHRCSSITTAIITAPYSSLSPSDQVSITQSDAKAWWSRQAIVHSLAHTESWAIDLSWFIIARFGKKEAMPREFFTYFVKVGQDERSHFTLLAARLNELGSSYGALPTHDGLSDSAIATSSELLAHLAIEHCVHEVCSVYFFVKISFTMMPPLALTLV